MDLAENSDALGICVLRMKYEMLIGISLLSTEGIGRENISMIFGFIFYRIINGMFKNRYARKGQCMK